jgi:hypothetical protein
VGKESILNISCQRAFNKIKYSIAALLRRDQESADGKPEMRDVGNYTH